MPVVAEVASKWNVPEPAMAVGVVQESLLWKADAGLSTRTTRASAGLAARRMRVLLGRVVGVGVVSAASVV
jgi:hypothetical protein